jgi:hypothetical protein
LTIEPAATARSKEQAARMGATELLAVYEMPDGCAMVTMSLCDVDGADTFSKGVCAIASVAMAFKQSITRMVPGVDPDEIGRQLMAEATEAMGDSRQRPGSYISLKRAPVPADGLDPDPSES